MAKASVLEWISWIVVTIAALNEGVDGVFNLDMLEMVVGEGTGEKIASWVIGLAGLYAAFLLVKYSQKKK